MIEGPRLATLVASKVCHDLVGPMTGMLQGLEMLKDADDGRNADALALLDQAVARVTAKADFLRHALADSIGQDGHGLLSEVRPAADKLFTTVKAELVWAPEATLMSRPALKVFLNLLAFAADCLPKGGTVTVTPAPGEITVSARGARATLKPDVSMALRGEAGEDGFRAGVAIPLLTGLIARQAGLELSAREAPEQIDLILRGPGVAGA